MIDFDEFWNIYPRKTAKKAAQKSWGRLNVDQELFEKIKENIESRLLSSEWLLTDKQYIPHPATYLNQERWEDEIIPKGEHNGQARQSREDRLRERISHTIDYDKAIDF